VKKLFRKIFLFVAKVLVIILVSSILWVLLYRFINPPISGMMVYKSLTEEDYSYQYEWRDLEEISDEIPLAFISAEDQLFLEHDGFDIDAIQDAMKHNKSSENKRGASTISQQVAKNVFLFPTKNFLRKGVEAYFTVLIESIWGKRRIMEVYVNTVELGEGVYGVEVASQLNFKKSASKINKTQAALFSAALTNPIKFKISAPSDYMRRKQSWVMKQMNNLGGVKILQSWYE